MKPNSLQNETETLTETEIAIAFTSVVAAVAAKSLSNNPNKRGKTNVSRQSSNSRRRKGTVKGPCGVQAHGRREIWSAILHHQPRREDCRDISLRGMAADRGEVGEAFQLQSRQEEFFDQDELLRASGRDRRSGPLADPSDPTGSSRDQGRSSCHGTVDASGSAEEGSYTHRGEGAVHGRG